MAPVPGVQVLGQPPADLFQYEADQRLGATDVGGRDDEIERRRTIVGDEIRDAPVARRVTSATTGSR